MTEEEKQQTPDTPPTPETPEPEAPTKPRFRDRVLGMRAVVAVALAGLILGGVGGAAVGVLVDQDHERGPGHFQRPGPPDGQRGGPPGIAPQDDVRPDSSGDTNSSGSSGSSGDST